MLSRIVNARVLGLGLCSLAVAACGAAAARDATARQAASPATARTVNPRAVPLGDGYLSTSPRVGYLDSCATHFGGGGAQVNGPWIDTRARTWNYAAKLAVRGAVRWPGASYRVRIAGSRRVITFNDLPTDHTTGVFPIAPDDPAYRYDRNPNRIAAQRFRWELPLHPVGARRPNCTGLGPIGVLSDGVVLYNALDAEGRDAGAHEVLDRCAGHPDPSDTYHHHYVPSCILNRAPRGRSTLVGYALDGYGIYVVKDAAGALPADTQFDACHGEVSPVLWDGRLTRIYHYVATLEYPYTVGCFHGAPITVARAAGAGAP